MKILRRGFFHPHFSIHARLPRLKRPSKLLVIWALPVQLLGAGAGVGIGAGFGVEAGGVGLGEAAAAN